MIKNKLNILVSTSLVLFCLNCFGQQAAIDSLKRVLKVTKIDTSKVPLYNVIADKVKGRLTLQKEGAEYEQKALHLQMNPHFVFDCLGSISSFIVQNGTDSALKYLSKFSKVMRLPFEVSYIIRCDAKGNYIEFFIKNHKPLLLSKTLKEYEELLTEHGCERIHQSHLINLSFLKSYIKSDGGCVIMADNTNIPIA